MSRNLEIAVLLSLIAIGFVLVGCVQSPPNTGCTQDAKICPDGSAVGRVPPSCEFAPCPSVTPTQEPVATATPIPTEEPLNLTAVNASSLEANEPVLNVLKPDLFQITVKFILPTPCYDSSAAWKISGSQAEVRFTHKSNLKPDQSCIQMIEERVLRTTLDVSKSQSGQTLKKIIVYNGDTLLKEFVFGGMMCGGIAAFMCPKGFDCNITCPEGWADCRGKYTLTPSQ